MRTPRAIVRLAFRETTAATVLALACSLGSWQAMGADAKPKTSWPAHDDKETIAAYAKRAGLKPTQTLDLGGGVTMEFVLVPAGSFRMGGPRKSQWEGQGNEGPVHKVTITKPFYLGKYEVTVAQFAVFANATKYQTDCEKAGHKGEGIKDGKWGVQMGVSWRNPGIVQTPDHPVVLVSWNDALAFAAWVSRHTGKDVRLPTEAQWEYAARGPKSLEYPFGGNWDGRKANHGDAALTASGWKHGCTKDNDGYAHTAPVGKFNNASWCGALDMAGNVWERVQDWEADYTVEAQVDPQGPASGQRRVDKGGSWVDAPQTCRAAARERKPPDERTMTNGMRVMMAASALDASQAAAESQSAPQASTTSVATPQIVKADEAGWISVFDGKTLNGWIQGGAAQGAAGVRVVNGAIEVNNQKMARALQGRDLAMRARVKKLDGANLTLDLRATTDTRYTAFYNGADSFGIGKSIKGQFTNLKTASARQAPGDFFLMTFRVAGKTLTLEVEGEEIARVQDGEILSGSPGIGARGGRSLFKDVQVCMLETSPKKDARTLPQPADAGKAVPKSETAPPARKRILAKWPDADKLVRNYSTQQIIALDVGETFTFKLKNGAERLIRLMFAQERKDSVMNALHRVDVRVEIDGKPLNLVCAPCVMPTEIAGLRIQADTTKGFWRELPKQVQFSLWDATDPIVDTTKFGFPIRNYRLFSHVTQAFNDPMVYVGDPSWRFATPDWRPPHHGGFDLAGYDGSEEIVSVCDGEALNVTRDPNNMSMGVIEATDYTWGYGHLSAITPDITDGIRVTKGQKLGLLGQTGGSGNFSHLHLGRSGSSFLNTYPWLVMAYQAERPKGLFAVARQHQQVLIGEKAVLDGAHSLAFGGAKITEWRWEFHDGQILRQVKAEKRYDQPGWYIASLWIKNSQGIEDVDFCQVKVFPQAKPTNDLSNIFMTYTPTEDVRPNQPVKFRFWFLGSPPVRRYPLTVEFSDGTRMENYKSHTEFTHAFKTPGIHIVTARTEYTGLPIMQKVKVVVARP